MSKRIISIVAIIALVAVLGVCLVACGAKADTFVKRLEKAGYTVESVELSSEEKDTGMVWAVVGQKAESITNIDMVTVIKFKTADDAAKAASQLENAAAIMGYEVVVDGTLIIYGTEQGVKDAK